MIQATLIEIPDSAEDCSPERDDLKVGIAAEHLVCADLLLQGYNAFRVEQTCPYDVLVDTGDSLVRIQVKATRKMRGLQNGKTAYVWEVRRGRNGHFGGRMNYEADDFDMLALVALDCRQIAYIPMPRVKTTIHIKSFEGLSFDSALSS